MKKHLYPCACALAGAAYGLSCVLLSRVFIRHLAQVSAFVMKLLKADAELTHQVKDALLQLTDARLISPWLIMTALCALLGLGMYFIIKRAKSIVIHAGAWLLLLIPLSLIAALFTCVNDIRFLDMVKLLIDIAKNL